MKQALRETQTLRVKNFPRRKLPSWGCRTAKI